MSHTVAMHCVPNRKRSILDPINFKAVLDTFILLSAGLDSNVLIFGSTINAVVVYLQL